MRITDENITIADGNGKVKSAEISLKTSPHAPRG